MSYPGGPYQQQNYPHYPPTSPPSPPPPPRPPSRWPAFGTERGILLYVLAPLLAVLLIVLLAVGISAARPRAFAQTPLPTVAGSPAATITPQGTPLATDTPASAAASAVLGATQDAFTAQFGQPQMHGPVPWYSITAADGIQLVICVCDIEAGTDGQGHVGILSVGPTDASASWPESQGIAESKMFFPADAVYVHDIQDPDVGTLHVYRSAQLAATFPASAFANTGPSGGLVPPGTFIIACEIPGPPGCDLRLGT